MKLERLYLDYNATSPLSQSVTHWLKDGEVLFANPSSQHTHGKAARKVINQVRSSLYSIFHLDEKGSKLFFHSGATEAIYTFAYSFSELARLKGVDLLICYSKIDHPAVTSLSEKYMGPHVKFLELKRDKDLGYLHQENYTAIKDKKDDNPGLIVLYHHLWVHNETGQVSPLGEISFFKEIPDLYIHVDAVQAPGKVLDWQNLSSGDIFSFSAHKFGALKGIGFSFFQSHISFHGPITGGGQQENMRSGTENVQGVKSIELALQDLLQVDIPRTIKLRSKLEDFFKKELKDMGGVVSSSSMASNTIYFYLNKFPSDVSLALFDIIGIEMSAGSACSSGAARPSGILLARGLSEVAKNGLRLSLPFEVTDTLIHNIQERIKPVFNKLREK